MVSNASTGSASIVEVDDLRKTYRSGLFGTKRLEALQGVSLDVRAGEIFGLLGPNGAGKTTLIKTLLGIVRKSSGTATLFGQPVGTTRSRYRIGYLPENLRVEKHHTARTALHLYGKLSRMPSRTIAERTEQLIQKVGLAGRDCESVRRFSKGMYQRLGLAQALMHDPDLLVLDEPTDGLDPVGRNEVRKVIERLRDLGKTIFLNSHFLQEVEMVCTQVAIMAGGKILASGPIGQLSGLTADGSSAAQPAPPQTIVIEVAAAPDLVRPQDSLGECFAAAAAEVSIVPAAESGHQITFRVTSQLELDQIVDLLRS